MDDVYKTFLLSNFEGTHHWYNLERCRVYLRIAVIVSVGVTDYNADQLLLRAVHPS